MMLLLGVGVGLILVMWPNPEPIDGIRRGLVDTTDPTAAMPSPKSDVESARSPVPVRRSRPGEVEIHCKSATTGEPVPARVWLGSWSAYADDEGRCVLPLDGDVAMIIAEHPGFARTVSPCPQERRVELRMEPKRWTRVLVVDPTGARPVAGAEIEVLSAEDRPRVVGRCDERGRYKLRHGREVAIRAIAEGRSSEGRVCLLDDSDVVLRLLRAEEMSRLALVHRGSEAPLSGMQVEAMRLDGERAWCVRLRTGDDGRATEAVCPGSYRLSVSGQPVELAMPGAGGRGFTRSLDVLLERGRTTIVLARSWTAPSIFLRDGRTGRSLPQGVAWLEGLENGVQSRQQGWTLIGRPYRFSRKGPVSLWPLLAGGAVDAMPALRLGVWSPGYDVEYHADPWSGARVLDALLMPSGKVELAFVGGGVGASHHVRIGERVEAPGALQAELPVHEGRVRGGEVVEMPWSGGDVVVRYGGPWNGRLVATVPSERLSRGGRARVNLPVRGAIRLETGGREPARLFATCGRGIYIPGLIRRGAVEFRDLLPGRYEVGTRESLGRKLRQAILRGFVGTVDVRPGETTDLRWRPEFERAGPVEGIASASGYAMADLFVFPRFEVASEPMSLSAAMPRSVVRESGRYVLGELDGRPRAVVIARRTARGRFLPLGVSSVLSRIDAECSMVRVRAKVGNREPWTVAWSVDEVDGWAFQGEFRAGAVGPGWVEVGLLPVSVKRIAVKGSTRTVALDVRLIPGRPTEIQVDLSPVSVVPRDR